MAFPAHKGPRGPMWSLLGAIPAHKGPKGPMWRLLGVIPAHKGPKGAWRLLGAILSHKGPRGALGSKFRPIRALRAQSECEKRLPALVT